MASVSFRFKDCSLFIDNKLVEKGDDLIAFTSELALGNVPAKLKPFGLREDELSELETLLSNEIFLKGNCLTPDENFLLEHQYDEDDDF